MKHKVIAVEIYLYLWTFLDFWHKILENLDVPGKSGLHIRIQQEKGYQNDELFFLGFEKALKMQVSVIFQVRLLRSTMNIYKFSSFRSSLRGASSGITSFYCEKC